MIQRETRLFNSSLFCELTRQAANPWWSSQTAFEEKTQDETVT